MKLALFAAVVAAAIAAPVQKQTRTLLEAGDTVALQATSSPSVDVGCVQPWGACTPTATPVDPNNPSTTTVQPKRCCDQDPDINPYDPNNGPFHCKYANPWYSQCLPGVAFPNFLGTSVAGDTFGPTAAMIEARIKRILDNNGTSAAEVKRMGKPQAQAKVPRLPRAIQPREDDRITQRNNIVEGLHQVKDALSQSPDFDTLGFARRAQAYGLEPSHALSSQAWQSPHIVAAQGMKCWILKKACKLAIKGNCPPDEDDDDADGDDDANDEATAMHSVAATASKNKTKNGFKDMMSYAGIETPCIGGISSMVDCEIEADTAASICEIVGLGPEDPFADICAVIMEGALNYACVKALQVATNWAYDGCVDAVGCSTCPLDNEPAPGLPGGSAEFMAVAYGFGNTAVCPEGFGASQACGSGENKNCKDMSGNAAAGWIACDSPFTPDPTKAPVMLSTNKAGTLQTCPYGSIMTAVCFSGADQDCASSTGATGSTSIIICTFALNYYAGEAAVSDRGCTLDRCQSLAANKNVAFYEVDNGFHGCYFLGRPWTGDETMYWNAGPTTGVTTADDIDPWSTDRWMIYCEEEVNCPPQFPYKSTLANYALGDNYQICYTTEEYAQGATNPGPSSWCCTGDASGDGFGGCPGDTINWCQMTPAELSTISYTSSINKEDCPVSFNNQCDFELLECAPMYRGSYTRVTPMVGFCNGDKSAICEKYCATTRSSTGGLETHNGNFHTYGQCQGHATNDGIIKITSASYGYQSCGGGSLNVTANLIQSCGLQGSCTYYPELWKVEFPPFPSVDANGTNLAFGNPMTDPWNYFQTLGNISNAQMACSAMDDCTAIQFVPSCAMNSSVPSCAPTCAGNTPVANGGCFSNETCSECGLIADVGYNLTTDTTGSFSCYMAAQSCEGGACPTSWLLDPSAHASYLLPVDCSTINAWTLRTSSQSSVPPYADVPTFQSFARRSLPTAPQAAEDCQCRATSEQLGPNGSGGANTFQEGSASFEICYATATRTADAIPRWPPGNFQCDYGAEAPICPTAATGCEGCAANFEFEYTCNYPAQHHGFVQKEAGYGSLATLDCSSLSTPEFNSTIVVEYAVYGANCATQPEQEAGSDQTSELGGFCNGKSTCDYYVCYDTSNAPALPAGQTCSSPAPGLGDPASGCPKNYQYTYICTGEDPAQPPVKLASAFVVDPTSTPPWYQAGMPPTSVQTPLGVINYYPTCRGFGCMRVESSCSSSGCGFGQVPASAQDSVYYYQIPGNIYNVNGVCYEAISDCTGCLDDSSLTPTSYPSDLREVLCPCRANATALGAGCDTNSQCSGNAWCDLSTGTCLETCYDTATRSGATITRTNNQCDYVRNNQCSNPTNCADVPMCADNLWSTASSAPKYPSSWQAGSGPGFATKPAMLSCPVQGTLSPPPPPPPPPSPPPPSGNPDGASCVWTDLDPNPGATCSSGLCCNDVCTSLDAAGGNCP